MPFSQSPRTHSLEVTESSGSARATVIAINAAAKTLARNTIWNGRVVEPLCILSTDCQYALSIVDPPLVKAPKHIQWTDINHAARRIDAETADNNHTGERTGEPNPVV